MGDGSEAKSASLIGCERLAANGDDVNVGPGVFLATVKDVDLAACAVTLDNSAPENMANQVAVFSNPDYEMTTAYHIANAEGDRLELKASTLAFGRGRARAIPSNDTVLSDIPHMYLGTRGTGMVNGKRLRTAAGKETRIRETFPGQPLRFMVDEASVLEPGELFEIMDLAPGDTVRIALPCEVTLRR